MVCFSRIFDLLCKVSILNTVYLNFKVFAFKDALHFPIICGRRITMKNLRKGCISIDCVRPAIVHLGIDEGTFQMYKGLYSYLNFCQTGKLHFGNHCNISSRFILNISGTVWLGENVSTGTGFLLSCEKSIEIQSGCMFGWNVTIIDGDGHKIYSKGSVVNGPKSVSIGAHCWIAANVMILKGVVLQSNTICPANMTVTKSNLQSGTVYGISRKSTKDDFCWEY